MDRLRRRGQSLTVVSEYTATLGHRVGRDALASHLKSHVGPEADGVLDTVVPGGSGTLVALAVYDVLGGWYSHRERIAGRLLDDGLVTEAAIVAADLRDDLNGVLEATAGTDAGDVFAARAVLVAMCVVHRRHPDVSREMAEELKRLGATELASVFIEVAAENEAASVSAEGRSGSGRPSVDIPTGEPA